MRFLNRRGGLAIVAAVTATILIVGPVAADTSISESGLRGFHALRDGQSTPGVDCRYKRVTPSPSGYEYEAKLNTVVVRPPRVKAHTGTQNVGWLFVVQRATLDGGYGTWSTRYTSPLQTRETSTIAYAAFDQMSVDVTVSTAGWELGPHYGYRVRVFMFWYNAVGKISGSSVHEQRWYRRVLRPDAWSAYSFTDVGPCYEWEYVNL